MLVDIIIQSWMLVYIIKIQDIWVKLIFFNPSYIGYASPGRVLAGQA